MGKRDDLGPSRLDRAGRALADGGHISGGLGEGSDMSKLKNAGTMLITAIPIVVWLWVSPAMALQGILSDRLPHSWCRLSECFMRSASSE